MCWLQRTQSQMECNSNQHGMDGLRRTAAAYILPPQCLSLRLSVPQCLSAFFE